MTRELLKTINTVLFDLDGVLWAGEKLLPGAASFLTQLEKSNVKTIFITNNSTKSRDSVVQKFSAFGISVDKKNVYTSSYAAAAYLKTQNFTKKAFVVGGKGIIDELDGCGIESLTYEGTYSGQVADVFSTPLDPDVGAVIAGLDVNFNYKKIALAQLYITQQKATFIGTNADVNYPYARGPGEPKVLLPGGGVVVGALETCTKIKPKIMGKPTPYMFELIQQEHDVSPDSCVFMGDNLLTDIKFGNNLGIRTIFMLTGVSTLEEVETLGIVPTYIARGVDHFVLEGKEEEKE